MTDIDESAPFDPDVLAATAEEYDVDPDSLARTVTNHQESMAALPGIENLAYEWRKQYESPLIERSDAAYYFAVPARVWEEFGEALDVSGTVRAALAEVHRRTAVARTGAATEPAADLTYVVLVRAFDERTPEQQ